MQEKKSELTRNEREGKARLLSTAIKRRLSSLEKANKRAIRENKKKGRKNKEKKKKRKRKIRKSDNQ